MCVCVPPDRKLKTKNTVVHRRDELLRPPLRAATHSQQSAMASSQIHSRKRAMVRDSHHHSLSHTHTSLQRKINWRGELCSRSSVTFHRDYKRVCVCVCVVCAGEWTGDCERHEQLQTSSWRECRQRIQKDETLQGSFWKVHIHIPKGWC